MALIIQTSSEALRKIGAFGKCMNLLTDKSTVTKCTFCSKMRLSNSSRRLFVKLTLCSLSNGKNASNSMALMEFRPSERIFKCRNSYAKQRNKQRKRTPIETKAPGCMIQLFRFAGLLTLKHWLSIVVISLLLKSKNSTRDDIPILAFIKFSPLFETQRTSLAQEMFAFKGVQWSFV